MKRIENKKIGFFFLIFLITSNHYAYPQIQSPVDYPIELPEEEIEIPAEDDDEPYLPYRDNFPIYFEQKVLHFEQKINELCEFKAEVTPDFLYSKVKKIYMEMCINYHYDFKAYPIRPELHPLHRIRFVSSWSEVEYVEGSPSATFSMNLRIEGVDYNEVVVLYPPENDIYITNQEWVESVLAHEIFHYFQKSCCYEKFKNIINMNTAIFESAAYWAQDEYLKRNFGKRLFDYVKIGNNAPTEKWDYVDHFEYLARPLYMMAIKQYIYNAPIWFGNNPELNYKAIIEGDYVIQRMGY